MPAESADPEASPQPDTSWRATLIGIQEDADVYTPDDYTTDRTDTEYAAVGLDAGTPKFEVLLDPGERRPVLSELRSRGWGFVPKRDDRYRDGWSDKRWLIVPPAVADSIKLARKFRLGAYPPAPDYKDTTAKSVVRQKEHEETVKEEFKLSGRQMLVLRYCANYDGPYTLVPVDAPPSKPADGTEFKLIAQVPPSEEQPTRDLLAQEAMKVPGIVVADWGSTPRHTTPADRHKVWVRLRYLPEEDNRYRE